MNLATLVCIVNLPDKKKTYKNLWW